MGLLLLFFALIFFTFYNEEYFFLSLTIMYSFVFPRLTTMIARNIQILETQSRLLEFARVNVELQSYRTKISTFKILRSLIMAYIGSMLIFSLLRLLLMWVVSWFSTLSLEVSHNSQHKFFFLSLLFGFLSNVSCCFFFLWDCEMTWFFFIFMCCQCTQCVTLILVATVCWLLRPRENGIFILHSEALRPIRHLQQFIERYQIFQNTNLNEILHSQSEMWDMSTTLLVEWPNDKLPTKYPSQLPLSLCIEEKK